MRTEQKSRTLPGLISVCGWLPLLLMTAVLCFAPPAALVSAAQTTEAETETAKTETTETKAPEKKPPAEDAEAGTESSTTADEQKETPKENSETPEKSEKKQEPPADSEKNPGPKEEPAAEKETAGPARDAQEMKSDESEKPGEEADPPAETKEEPKAEAEPKPKPESPKPDTKLPVTPEHPKKKKCIIGSTAVLLEKQSEIQFRARVDTGAKSCSLHVEKIKIEDESKKENITERMTENIGKVIHFEVKNGNKKTHILTSKIAGYVIIKTSDKKEGKRRYKVPLTFRWKSMEKEILVTLNNRNHMAYPLLLGRNFLKGDFLVDVELNNDD